jgi:hypothetical protein
MTQRAALQLWMVTQFADATDDIAAASGEVKRSRLCEVIDNDLARFRKPATFRAVPSC